MDNETQELITNCCGCIFAFILGIMIVACGSVCIACLYNLFAH